MSFENKILRIIYGLVYDNELGCWCRRKNQEIRELTEVPRITNYEKALRTKWLGHVIRRHMYYTVKPPRIDIYKYAKKNSTRIKH